MVWNVFFTRESREWYEEGRISSRFILDGIRSPIPLVILGSVFSCSKQTVLVISNGPFPWFRQNPDVTGRTEIVFFNGLEGVRLRRYALRGVFLLRDIIGGYWFV